MMLAQQWQCLNLARNIFYILFPSKGVMSYKQIISSRLYIYLKETCSFARQALLTLERPGGFFDTLQSCNSWLAVNS